MSASARRGAIVVVLVAAVGAAIWSLMSSETCRGRGEARALYEALTKDAAPADVRAPRHRETPAADAPPADESAAPEPPLKPETLTIHVLSADDDAPIAGATVRALDGIRDENPVATATSDASGVAKITVERGLDNVTQFFVRANGFVGARCRDPDRRHGGDEEVSLWLQPGTALEGVAVEAGTGRPLAGVRLVAEKGGEAEMHCFGLPDLPYAEVVTGADGAFRLDGIPKAGETWLIVTAAGHVRRLISWNSSRPRRIEVRLEPAGQIHGVVRDADGAPVKGAQIKVRRARDGEVVWYVDASTTADGAYELDGLPFDETYDLWAAESDYDPARASAPATSPRLTADAPAAVQDLVFFRPAALVVRVRDADGAPTPDARVRLETTSLSDSVGVDETGVVEVAVAQPGRCRVSVASAGFVAQKFEFDLAPGAKKTMDVVLSRGLALTGVVVDESGETFEDIEVVAHPHDGDDGAKSLGRQSTKSAADGSFRLTGLAPAAYDVSTSAAGMADARIESVAAPKDGLRLVLGTKAQGYIRYALFGLPDDAEVVLSYRLADGRAFDPHVVSRSTGPNGGHGAPAGAHDVVFTVDGFAPATRHVEIVVGETTDLGEIALERGLAMNGRVVDPGGRPVEGACVKALVGVERADFVAWTDAAGAFRLLRLPTASVAVTVVADGFAAAETASKPSPASTPLVVTIHRGGVLTVRVVDPARRHDPDQLSVDAAGPLVDGAAPKPAFLCAEDDGRFTRRLAPGRWRLRVLGEDDAVLATKDVEIREGEDAPVELVLDK